MLKESEINWDFLTLREKKFLKLYCKLSKEKQMSVNVKFKELAKKNNNESLKPTKT